MIKAANYKFNCLIHGDSWTSHESVRQLNPASSVPIHLHGNQCGWNVPRYNAKRPAEHFQLQTLKECLHSLSPFTSPSPEDGLEIPKCCGSESSEPVLDGPENGSYFRMDDIFSAFHENQDFDERYQPVEEPWLRLPSVLPIFVPEDNSTSGKSMEGDEIVDAIEKDTMNSNSLLRNQGFDVSFFFRNVKTAFEGNAVLEHGKNFSGTNQLVEEPWLVYPAMESVNADASSTTTAFTGGAPPEDEQKLRVDQEYNFQIPDKVIAEAESKRLTPKDSICTEILINCSVCSMQRIAVLEDGELVELLLEPVKDNALSGSVYLGVVKKLAPQMGGAFVDIGSKPSLMDIQKSKQPFIFPPFCSTTKGEDTNMMREHLAADQNVLRAPHGVQEPDDAEVDFQDGRALYINGDFADHEGEDDDEVDEFKSRKPIGDDESTDHLHDNARCSNHEDSRIESSTKYSWADVQEGTKIIVQVVREGLGRKGPYVTPYPVLKSRFWILSTRGGHIGISKSITGVERARLRIIAKSLQPPGFGLIVRTVADGHSIGELRKDLEGLLSTWKSIAEHAKSAALAADEGVEDAVPVILHQAMGRTLSVVQDYFSNKVKRMVVDSPRTYHEVTSYLQEIAPDLCGRVELHNKKVPLFHEFNIEDEINNILNKRVVLPDGSSLVIEQTEALVSIDVNGGHKMLGEGSSQEKAVLEVNLAAAKRIARELRLKDIGGIIVVDFIDMHDDSNKRLVYEEMVKAVERDRSPVQVRELSKNGLMEITRKRVRPSVTFLISEPCPCCHATGRVEALETSFSKIEHEICRLLAEMDQRADPVKPKSWPKLLLRVDGYMSEYLTSGKKTRLATLCSALKVWIILKVVRSFTRGAFELKLLTDDKPMNDKNLSERRVQPVEPVTHISARNIAKFFPGKLWRKDTRFT